MVSISRPSFPLRVEYVPPKSDVMRVLFWTFAFAMMAFALIAFLEGCGTTMTADERYRAQIALCVERATTKLESKACRANVDFQFRIHDGGVP